MRFFCLSPTPTGPICSRRTQKEPNVFSLQGKIALVTGAASGIGAATAEMFARAGATVWVVDRDEANGRQMAEKIGGRFFLLDVAREMECGKAAAAIGAIDVLANIAGIGHVGTLQKTTVADLDRLYEVN